MVRKLKEPSSKFPGVGRNMTCQGLMGHALEHGRMFRSALRSRDESWTRLDSVGLVGAFVINFKDNFSSEKPKNQKIQHETSHVGGYWQ